MNESRERLVTELMKSEGWSHDVAMTFTECVYDYLFHRNYFIGDCDGHPGSEHEQKKSELPFHDLLSDMAEMYAVEHGIMS